MAVGCSFVSEQADVIPGFLKPCWLLERSKNNRPQLQNNTWKAEDGKLATAVFGGRCASHKEMHIAKTR